MMPNGHDCHLGVCLVCDTACERPGVADMAMFFNDQPTCRYAPVLCGRCEARLRLIGGRVPVKGGWIVVGAA